MRTVSSNEFSGKVFCNPRFDFAYFAIPKAANSTMQLWFFETLGDLVPDRIRDIVKSSLAVQPLMDHPEVPKFLVKNGFLRDKGDVLARNYKHKFAVVRHPIDRLASCWRDKILRQAAHSVEGSKSIHSGLAVYGERFWSDMPFESFVRAVVDIPNSQANPHFRNQVDFLGLDGRSSQVPRLLKLENLDEDFAKLAAEIGTTVPLGRRVNSSSSTMVEEVSIAPHIREQILSRYKEDISALGYGYR